MTQKATFPFPNPERFGDARTIAERAGIELRGEDGQPFHCGERMETRGGILGTDYARCRTCGLKMVNAASPHVNGGLVLNEDIMEEYGESLWAIPQHTEVWRKE